MQVRLSCSLFAAVLIVSLTNAVFADQQESRRAARAELAGTLTGVDWSAVPRTQVPEAASDGGFKAVPNTVVPNTSTLYFSGNTTYQTFGNQVRMTADRINNDSYTYTTGTLRLALWFSTLPFPASGYETATYALGQLSPRYYYYSIDSGYVTFYTPPTGCYYATLLLEEWDGSQYVYVDYVAYSNRASINGGCAPAAPTINSFGASPSTVSSGGTSLLSWSTSNATSASIDHGVGAVGTNSSVLLAPSGTTTYTLTASNGSTQVTRSLTVTVNTANPCNAANTICLSNNRFATRITWRTKDTSGVATPIKYTTDSGLFWFFGSDNIEVLLKILNACSLNNRYWIFSAATTDVEYTITVTDTLTGRVKTYFHSLGSPAPAITDTDAMPCS